jgi:tRNA 2-thiouridine synthesizing protein A
MLAAHPTINLSELGCGDLVMALMKAVTPLEAGQIIDIIAHDPGAKEDIPAWCRITGHELLSGPSGNDGSLYTIRKKGGK